MSLVLKGRCGLHQKGWHLRLWSGDVTHSSPHEEGYLFGTQRNTATTTLSPPLASLSPVWPSRRQRGSITQPTVTSNGSVVCCRVVTLH